MNVNNEIKRLAREHCAAFTGTDGCRFEPNGQPKCTFFRDDAQALPFIEDGTIRCFEFERGVLPADPALEARYFNREVNEAKCVRCRKPIVKASNAAKYCGTCRGVRRKQADAERQRRRYRNLTQ